MSPHYHQGSDSCPHSLIFDAESICEGLMCALNGCRSANPKEVLPHPYLVQTFDLFWPLFSFYSGFVASCTCIINRLKHLFNSDVTTEENFSTVWTQLKVVERHRYFGLSEDLCLCHLAIRVVPVGLKDTRESLLYPSLRHSTHEST